jgi:hypothetical protein
MFPSSKVYVFVNQLFFGQSENREIQAAQYSLLPFAVAEERLVHLTQVSATECRNL